MHQWRAAARTNSYTFFSVKEGFDQSKNGTNADKPILHFFDCKPTLKMNASQALRANKNS